MCTMQDQIKPSSEVISPDGSISASLSQEGTLQIWIGEKRITDFFPAQYCIVPSTRMRCIHETQAVEINWNKIDDNGFIPAVLHEAGHATCDTEEDKRKDTEISQIISNLAITPEDDTTYTDIFREWVELVERRERNAWIYSLYCMQQLIDEGFDIRNKFSSFDEFRIRIMGHYNSYRSAMKYKYDRSGRGTQQQLTQSIQYVDQIFDKHMHEISDMIAVVWNHTSTDEADTKKRVGEP